VIFFRLYIYLNELINELCVTDFAYNAIFIIFKRIFKLCQKVGQLCHNNLDF